MKVVAAEAEAEHDRFVLQDAIVAAEVDSMSGVQ